MRGHKIKWLMFFLALAMIILCMGNSLLKSSNTYTLPFEAGEIEYINFRCVNEGQTIRLTQEEDILKIVDLLRQIKISEDDNSTSANKELPLGGIQFYITIAMPNGDMYYYSYYQRKTTAYGGQGTFTDSVSSKAVSNLDLTRIWRDLESRIATS